MTTRGLTEPLSLAPPTALDLALSEALERDLRERGLYESSEESIQREEARARPPPPPRQPGARLRLCFSPFLPSPTDSWPAGRSGEGLGAQGERDEGLCGAGVVRGALPSRRAPAQPVRLTVRLPR